MVSITRSIVAFALVFVLMPSFAQQPKKVSPKPVIEKYKLPKLFTVLGSRSDSVVVPIEEALQLIGLPLRITDDKKNMYPVFSYQCLYKRRSVTEDEATGKVSPISSIVNDRFKTTPLPTLWKTIITQQLKNGEEIFFYDIVVKDASGKLMFAPAVKIKVL